MGRRRCSNFPAIWFNRAATVTVSAQNIVSTSLAASVGGITSTVRAAGMEDTLDTATATDAL